MCSHPIDRWKCIIYIVQNYHPFLTKFSWARQRLYHVTILLILTSPGFGERDLDYILQNHCSKSFHSRNCIKSLKVILVDGLYFINWLHDSWCYTAVSALIMINIIIKLNCNMFKFFYPRPWSCLITVWRKVKVTN